MLNKVYFIRNKIIGKGTKLNDFGIYVNRLANTYIKIITVPVCLKYHFFYSKVHFTLSHGG